MSQIKRGKLFQYAIIHHPAQTKEQNDRGESPKSVVITEPTPILALDEAQAGIVAARTLTDEFVTKLDEVEILVRPF